MKGSSSMVLSLVIILELGIYNLYISIEGFKWRIMGEVLGGGRGILFFLVG